MPTQTAYARPPSEDGQETIAGARKQADALLADARAQGETEGAALLAVDRARARRTARSVVLAAQRAAYDELHRQACDGSPSAT